MSRIKGVHARFLDSCRSLKEGRAYWAQAGGFKRWFLQWITPVPLLGLHQEGRLLLRALQWLEANCRERPLREEVIRQYHRMVFGEGSRDGGVYRNHPIAVVGSAIPRTAPSRVPAFMKQLDLRIIQGQGRLDTAGRVEPRAVLCLAAEIHQRIGLIHPFPDGNGRVSRLAMNHVLRRYGIGYVILPPLNESAAHMEALQEAHAGRLDALIRLSEEHLYPV